MPKFITIGYGDEAGYARTAASVRDAAHAQWRKTGCVAHGVIEAWPLQQS